MKICKSIISILILGLATNATAQSTLNVCLDKTTSKLTAKSTCTKNEIVVTGKNLVTNSLSLINFDACYQTSAKKSGSTFDGRVAVGLLCKQKTDLLLNDQFTTNETSGAKPVLESKRLVITNKIPNGVDYGMIATGGNNKFYEVQIAATCCPIIKR